MYKKYTNRILGNVEAEIFKLYLDMKEHYFSEICDKTDIARPSVLRTLRKFEKLGIFKTLERANTKFYKLVKSPIFIILISLVEYEKSLIFLDKNDKIRHGIEIIDKELNPTGIIIFGSYAKGAADKHSDLDVLLIMNFDKKTIRKSEYIAEIIHGRTGIKLSPVIMKIDDLTNKNEFMQEIIKSHILVKGSELFYEAIL